MGDVRTPRAGISADIGIGRPVTKKASRHHRITGAALLSVSYLALAVAFPLKAHAQTTAPGASQLPPVQIDDPARKPRRKQAEQRSRTNTPATRARRNAQRPPAQPAPAAPAAADTHDTRTGTVGVYANSTS